MPICPTCREHYLGDESFCPRDGTPLSASQVDPLLGQVLGGRYLVETRIGEGGMGTVYRARQQSLDRAVAVKLLRRDLVGDDAAVVRFQREARAASSLDHPNCIKVLDFGQTADGLLFLVMELLSGESLGQVLLRGPLPVPRALAIMRAVALALAHAHEHAIIHRDLKPDNVYLCHGDVVKVLDFGLCKRVSDLDAGVTQAGVVFGTPEYMSPEQAEAKPLDPRSDLYSLGAVMFRAVTGDLPFHASTYVGLLTQHVSAVPPRPSAVRPELGIPPAVDELILRLLEKDPDRRPPSARALVEEIDRCLGVPDAARAGDAAPQPIPVFPSGPVPATAVPQLVPAVPSGPAAAPPSGPVAYDASQPYAAAPGDDAGAALSATEVPRTSRAPLLALVLLVAAAGAGIVLWQGGWLPRRAAAPVVAGAPADAGAPASAPAPVGLVAASGPTVASAPADAAVPRAPHPPHPGKAHAAAAKAPRATPADGGTRKPPRETTVAHAPQRDAGPPPPPVVKVTPPPQQDAGPPPLDTSGERVAVHLVKARVAVLRGDLDGALRELEAARGLRENAAVHVGFAEVYSRQGNTLRALAHWQKAVNMAPRDATLRVRFAEALARAGEVEEACNAVRAALALKPQHARALALQGRLQCLER